jgi:hypothetical protein
VKVPVLYAQIFINFFAQRQRRLKILSGLILHPFFARCSY